MSSVMPRNTHLPPPVAVEQTNELRPKTRKNKPRTNGNGPRNAPHTSLFRHRTFTMFPVRDGWVAKNTLPHLAFGIPRAFQWKGADDLVGIKSYIDLITAGRKAEAQLFETQGSVFSVEMDSEELTGSIKCNFGSFLDLISLRGHVDFPLRSRVQFLTNGHKLIPADFITLLAKYVPNPGWLGDPNNWHKATEEELDQITREHGEIHAGMYRDEPNLLSDSPAVAAVAVADELSGRTGPEEDFEPDIEPEVRAPPPQESEIRRSPYDRHFELVTVVTDGTQRPFYARRLARYDGQLLWAGSSYSVNGPWTEYHRDNGQLLALGLNP
jgi:hypothetical protein